MQPRAVRRPSTATALKKRPIPKMEEETEEEIKETESVDQKVGGFAPSDSRDEEPRGSFLSSQVTGGSNFSVAEYHEMDRAERLDLDDHEPASEPDDDPASHAAFEGSDNAVGQNDMHDDIEPNWDEEDYGNEPEMAEEEEQIEGQEEELLDGEEEDERHEVVKERRKRKEFEIFIGGLDRDATEEDLKKVFSEVGEVTEMRLMKISGTQKNKGFAFLQFATIEQARRAVNELPHPMVNGKRCGVSPSQDSDTIFVGNICKSWSKEVLKEKLVKYGVEKYEELTLVEDAKNEGMNRGFAFLDFSSRSDALDACKRLQKRDVVLGTDRPAKVSFADSFIEPDDEIMAQVRTIFVDGLPASWDEEKVKDFVTSFGKIEKVELARHMPAAKRQDFGFITFDTHGAALACIEGINNTELSDGDRKVKVRARLSRPRQRVKPSRHGRSGYPTGFSDSRGGRVSWNYHLESWKFGGRSERSLGGRPMYHDKFRRFEGPKAQYSIDMGINRIGSRRGFPSTERPHFGRSPVPSNGKMNLRRNYIRHDEPHPRSADFFSRSATERHFTHRDHAYPSRGLDYLDSLPPGASRSATRRPFYAEESYGRPMERPSNYRDSHIREYDSISGAKRTYSVMDDLPGYGESGRHSRARYVYAPNNTSLTHADNDYYSHESARLSRGSHIRYERGSRGARGHLQESYEARTSNLGYGRGVKGGLNKGYAGVAYSGYGRSHVSRGEDLDGSSYSSPYTTRGSSGGYLSASGSGSYY